ncbi:transmembrane protease serine 9 [Danaus plexippus plexippus]|uniref:Transmembrane protease serine 9 n=1 Tax=Danaus plexippus plexippus TaxID=278856 RepID=A0A212EH71_DANPL|nr:transmembrane protease serine 9 [Danaus plexippus plexippus]
MYPIRSLRSLSGKFAVAGNLRNVDFYPLVESDTTGQWRKLRKVVYPWTYTFPRDDIAIVFLRSPFIYNSFVNYVPIASKSVDYQGKCLVSGYGRISQKDSSDKLLLAQLDLIPMRACNRKHRRNMRRFVCTSSLFTDVGKGDSGGPLVCSNTGDPNEEPGKGVLIGVVSGHRYGAGSFFTRVSSYYKYVKRNKSNKLHFKYSVVAFKSLIRRPRLYNTFCGGVIMTPTKLLSAAHCFVTKGNFCQRLIYKGGILISMRNKYAVAGHLKNVDFRPFIDSNSNGQWRRLRGASYPSTYKFPRDDIAIVFIRSPFNFNNFVNNIPIASTLVDYEGKCLASGFGRISQKKSSDKLLLAELELIPMKECDRRHRQNMRKFVCTSSIVSDVDKGDSGGPLVCTNTGDPNEELGKGVLIGIVAFKSVVQRPRLCKTFCGGVIMTPTKLLSAAHCFVEKGNICQRLLYGTGSLRSLMDKYAVAGNLRNTDFRPRADSNNQGQWRKLKRVVYPKTYKFPKDDIAVVFLRSPFIYNSYVNYVPIARKLVDYHGECLVSGFGRISHKASSDKLLLANLKLMPMKGDSGGPLVCANTGDPNEQLGKGILVGIVSGHRYGSGSFFTRVSSYYKYIQLSKSNRLHSRISIVIIIQTIILLF